MMLGQHHQLHTKMPCTAPCMDRTGQVSTGTSGSSELTPSSLWGTAEDTVTQPQGLLQRPATAVGAVMTGILLHGCACMWQETLLHSLASRLCGPPHTAPGVMLSLHWLLPGTQSRKLRPCGRSGPDRVQRALGTPLQRKVPLVAR